MIPPRSLFVAKGKAGRTRTIPLNGTAERIPRVLCEDVATGKWLFLNREGKPLGSIKKGFASACERAGIEDLRPYDLSHTFATRLVERGVPTPLISALLGHSMPVSGFGHESRITPGYAHATCDAMKWAVESLQQQPLALTLFGSQSSKSQAKSGQNDMAEKKLKVG